MGIKATTFGGGQPTSLMKGRPKQKNRGKQIVSVGGKVGTAPFALTAAGIQGERKRGFLRKKGKNKGFRRRGGT